jgi:hypothetical protein
VWGCLGALTPKLAWPRAHVHIHVMVHMFSLESPSVCSALRPLTRAGIHTRAKSILARQVYRYALSSRPRTRRRLQADNHHHHHFTLHLAHPPHHTTSPTTPSPRATPVSSRHLVESRPPPPLRPLRVSNTRPSPSSLRFHKAPGGKGRRLRPDPDFVSRLPSAGWALACLLRSRTRCLRRSW